MPKSTTDQQADQISAEQGSREIISTPMSNCSDQNSKYLFGYYETQGRRRTQEDALAWQALENSKLGQLSPQDIGMRLWTTYRKLDKDHQTVNKLANCPGTTASTTVFDGKGNLITATLADAVSFAAIYDNENKIQKVIRLNSVTHNPTNERERIIKAGGTVTYDGRLEDSILVSRAIGDDELKSKGMISSAKIDITSVDRLARDSGINVNSIGKIQIITTCDGFTEPCKEQTKEEHEHYLFNCLKQQDGKTLTEEALAKFLAGEAYSKGSRDNISVAVQTIEKPLQHQPAFMMGVYDGHGGNQAAHYVANNIGKVFNEQCELSAAKYEQHELSVHNHKEDFEYDHKHDENFAEVLPAPKPKPIQQPQKAPQQPELPPAAPSTATTSVVRKIKVNIPGDDPIELPVYPGDTILSIKQDLLKRRGIPLDQHRLYINSKLFPTNHELNEEDCKATVTLITRKTESDTTDKLVDLSYEQIQKISPAVAKALESYYSLNPIDKKLNSIKRYWDAPVHGYSHRERLLKEAASQPINEIKIEDVTNNIQELQNDLKQQDSTRRALQILKDINESHDFDTIYDAVSTYGNIASHPQFNDFKMEKQRVFGILVDKAQTAEQLYQLYKLQNNDRVLAYPDGEVLLDKAVNAGHILAMRLRASNILNETSTDAQLSWALDCLHYIEQVYIPNLHKVNLGQTNSQVLTDLQEGLGRIHARYPRLFPIPSAESPVRVEKIQSLKDLANRNQIRLLKNTRTLPVPNDIQTIAKLHFGDHPELIEVKKPVQIPVLQNPPSIISKPALNKSDQNEAYHFGYCEDKGKRNEQEDALAWHVLQESDLNKLSPKEIGLRLWTSYMQLDEDHHEAQKNKTDASGTTASTTVFDGKGNLITATLADSASFAAIYDSDNKIKAVIRLNSLTHKPEYEIDRIIKAGGYVQKSFGEDRGRTILDWQTYQPENEREGENQGATYRVQGALSVSRAIGDYKYKDTVIPCAKIDITNVEELARRSSISVDNIGRIQIITTCDGFTDASGTKQTSAEHEAYLLKLLQEDEAQNKNEQELATFLVKSAIKDDSKDNVSVAVQTIPQPLKHQPAFMMGVYDGHNGNQAAHYVADNIGNVFSKLCRLSASDYEKHKLSVHNNREEFEYDHKTDNNYKNYHLANTVQPKHHQEIPKQWKLPPAAPSTATTSVEPPDGMLITVNCQRKGYPLTVFPGETLFTIRQKIALIINADIGIPFKQQGMTINNKVFPDSLEVWRLLTAKENVGKPLTFSIGLKFITPQTRRDSLGHLSYEQIEMIQPQIAEALHNSYNANPLNRDQDIRQYWNDQHRTHAQHLELLEMTPRTLIQKIDDAEFSRQIQEIRGEVKKAPQQLHEHHENKEHQERASELPPLPVSRDNVHTDNKTVSPQPKETINSTVDLLTVQKAVKSAVDKYEQWFKFQCTSNKTEQETAYKNWYTTKYSQDTRKELNNSTGRDEFIKDHRGAAGMFTRFFHGQLGQNKAQSLLKSINDCNSLDEAIECIKKHLLQKQTSYRAHSFASFLLDELRGIQGSPWEGLKPGKDNRYSQEKVGEKLNSGVGQATPRSPGMG